jgi:hypothetical protein
MSALSPRCITSRSNYGRWNQVPQRQPKEMSLLVGVGDSKGGDTSTVRSMHCWFCLFKMAPFVGISLRRKYRATTRTSIY